MQIKFVPPVVQPGSVYVIMSEDEALSFHDFLTGKAAFDVATLAGPIGKALNLPDDAPADADAPKV